MKSDSLLNELIKIESVSGNEGRLGQFIAKTLGPHFKVKKIRVDRDRFNVIATSGRSKIYLNTHLDTVPKNGCERRETRIRIYGRGACDAKGSMSSMICAAIELRERDVTDFGLFFDVGEETDFSGIKSGLPERSPPFVVIGEPTELFPVIGQKGILEFTVTAKGKSAHGATPEKGISAITKLVGAIKRLERIAFPSDPILGKTAVNIGMIEGGTTINVVPREAKISVGIRTVTKNTVYKRMIENVLSEFNIRYLNSYDPKVIRDKQLITRVERIAGKKREVKKAFTELYFWPKGIVCGPGSPSQAHTDNEYVDKKQLERAVEVYKKFVVDYTETKK